MTLKDFSGTGVVEGEGEVDDLGVLWKVRGLERQVPIVDVVLLCATR